MTVRRGAGSGGPPPGAARGEGSGASALLDVRVVPRASRDEIAGTAGGVLRVRLSAPPVDDRANEALVRFLAGILGVPRGRIAVVGGRSGRNKRVRVTGLTTGEVASRLDAGGIGRDGG